MKKWRIRNTVTLVGLPEWIQPGREYKGQEEAGVPPKDPPQIRLHRPGHESDVAWISRAMLEEVP